MEKKEFAFAVLDPEHKTLVVYVASFSSTLLDIYPSCRPQMVGLIAKKSLIKISAKYADFLNVFSPDLAFKLFKHTGINNHIIKLVNNQQLPYKPIYSLKSIKLETLKAYIEINLANGFIRLSKSQIGASIFFNQNLNRLLWLYANYRGFNNFTIKNWYPLPIVGELLNSLGRARQFI